ncbi:hypothetical protein LXL04_023131 [Taraxacum kok-saghyz]
MSPASKSKSKEKRAAAKDPLKSSTKITSNPNSGGGTAASGYNPLLGTFHALDINTNTDEHNNTQNALGVEYDSVSNNGSWSGESEDHKDKTSSNPSRPEQPPPGVDNDKREKIRQKNEKKHQRQKERRAQELHERCSGYLMSRKLEALAQQLVSMGFSSERATMALILNEGRVEQSVAWLFDGGDDSDHRVAAGGHLKIDISEELSRITDMETKFKCSKQEVERAVVACEGDLDQAAETLKSQKHEPPAAIKHEESGEPPAGPLKPTVQNSVSRTLLKPQKTEDKDFNYTKTVNIGPPAGDPGIKSLQLLKKIPATSEKRAAAVAVAVPPPPPKTELKSLQLGSVREPVIVMQRPKSKPVPTVSSTSSSEWHPTVTAMNPTNGFSHGMSTYGTSVNTQFQQSGMTHFNNGGMWNRMGSGTTTTPTLAAASSLGLFTGSNGSSGPSSPVDWNAGDSVQFDYTNIDWSLDRIPARPNGMWMNFGAGNGGEFYSQAKAATRPPGLHPEVAVVVGSDVAAGGGGGGREWSSPFEEKELFSFPRQFVSSPSL